MLVCIALLGDDGSVVRLLLDRGAEMCAKHSTENTPLHLAANEGHEATVRLLLDRGAADLAIIRPARPGPWSFRMVPSRAGSPLP